MKTNPGGQLDPSDVIGRDELIKNLWDTLETQSIIMTAERRIGKTSVMNKMRAQPAKGWLPIYQDLEKHQTALEFAIAVAEKVQAYLSIQKRASMKASEVLAHLDSVKVGSFDIGLNKDKKITWQKLLENTIRDLVSEQSQDNFKVIFLWDEMPYMLGNIKENEGEDAAKQVLDILRALRHENSGFRMLITGSIGLHHVLTDLKNKGYRNQPVNDMYAIEVKPLEEKYAIELADTLLKGEGINSMKKISPTIAKEADNFPFYIHHIVKSLKAKQATVTPDDVRTAVENHITDANDPWQLRHYVERIPTYYGEDKAEIIELILDELAVQESALSSKELLNRLTSQTDALSKTEELKKLLELLVQDHYLSKEKNKYSFRFSLIKRWWKLERELEA